MFSKLSLKFLQKENKVLFANFISLIFLQGINYIVPLITLPYLVRVLGVENFGLLSFAAAVVFYFNVVVEYGFNLSATREISIHKEDKAKIDDIVSTVFTTKIYLFILSSLIFFAIVFLVGKFNQNALLYCLMFGTVFGQMLFPQWFFQGLEKMQYITYLNLISKSVYTVGIFLFVHAEKDVWLVPLLNVSSMLFVGMISLMLLLFKYKIKLSLCNIECVIHELKSGWHIFSAQIFTLVYTNSIIVILGFFSNTTLVGYYAIADRVVKIVASVFGPFQGAFYPYINKIIVNSKKEAIQKLRHITYYAIWVMGFVSIIIFFLSKYIVFLIAGEYITESQKILEILAPLPLILTLAKILSFNYIISFGYKEFLPKIYLVTGIISIISFFIVVPIYQAIGMAYCVLLSEIFATAYMYRVVKTRIIDGK